ncbi:PfkB family carbohydrate kinase [Brachybacterium sp. DNPG3]
MTSDGTPTIRPRGLFAGLATLDVIHRVDPAPGPDEKVTARAQFVAAGGPAANAAVAFSALGGRAVLLTALGRGPIARTIAAELAEQGVEVVDLAPDLEDAAPVSSVAVREATGERSIVGGDAAGLVLPTIDEAVVADAVEGADVVLLDGHHPLLARAVLDAARSRGLPVVLDAGRWKPIMEELVGAVTDVVTSEGFRLPGTTAAEESAAAILRRGASDDRGVRTVATTAGPGPVRWWSAVPPGSGSVAVPAVRAVDTLGAGDVLHGAYALALARGADLERRLAFAAEVAAVRCTFVGPRSWTEAVARVRLRGPAVRSDGGARL